MIDVDQIIADSTAQAKRAGCTCAVLVEVDVCDGDETHAAHAFGVRRLHASKCWLMLRAWRPWN